MNVMKLLGDLLDGSGWSYILTEADVTSAGRADGIIKGSHVTRCRYAHQVTVVALQKLKLTAYNTYIDSLAPYDVPMSFDMWATRQASHIPMFQYWNTVQDLELLALQYVRSLREEDFELYVQCLKEIAPWLFSMDHTHYARWLPLHIRDMEQLEKKSSIRI